jgi:hypothetical protein
MEPATESQKIFHAETLRAYHDLVQQRRKRLDSMLAKLLVRAAAGSDGLYCARPFLLR